ncbi:MAG: RNase H family protein [Planctomycetaceae bacterium]
MGIASIHARQVPADRHNGTAGEFLRRHECEAKQAARSSRRELQEFANQLLTRAGDTRNVKTAIEHCASRGQAAGPNGLKPNDLDNRSQWELARALGELISEGQYRPSEPRTVWIDKGRDRDQRPIRIQNFEDRCVERAVLQVINPILEAQFGDHSMGFRNPGYSRDFALATAEHWALTHNQWSWISEDLRDAFENVPTGRLSQALRRMIPSDEICDFISRIAFNTSGRGLRQGGPLSPALLNVYLHGTLDRWWQQTYPRNPLLRVADDLLILAQPDEVQSLYSALQQRTVSIGMPLKGTSETSIRDLTTGQSVDWLGYQIQRNDSELQASICQKAWDKLEDNLNLAWESPIPSLAAYDTIRGWISQQGATYQESRVTDVYREISRLALLCGFQETPTSQEVAYLWSTAYDRDWIQARRDVVERYELETMPADGSARQHSEPAAVSCRGSVANVTSNSSQLAPRRREVFLYCDGSCLPRGRVGAWGFLSIDRETGHQISNGQACFDTTNNRMELMAVIQGLSSLSEPSRVHLVLDSRYVADGITHRLPNWIANHWRTTGRRRSRVKNVDLWRQLVAQLERHEVDCEWVRGHNGHPENEFVGHMVNTIAEQALQHVTSSSSTA